MRLGAVTLVALLPSVLVQGASELGWGNDTDVTSFVTRPELKAPKFNVTFYDEALVTPGYYFIGPYIRLQREGFPQDHYQACQVGPHIIDNYGELVWSGACQFKNANSFDLRAYTHNGTQYLSVIVLSNSKGSRGQGVIMDGTYTPVTYVQTLPVSLGFNLHELNIVDDGTKAIYIVNHPRWVDMTLLGEKYGAGFVMDGGFAEIDIGTGEITNEWWAYENGVELDESTTFVEEYEGPFPRAWNYLHPNSVDKCNGDYLFSIRFTDSIMRISGYDGDILWRLGGTESSFKLDGFNFSRQHDARWLECGDDKEVISFMDNAADNISGNVSSLISSVAIVELDKKTMEARLLKRWYRPDGRRTTRRGSLQLVDKDRGNIISGWSDDIYITEHTADGKLIMEMRGLSTRTTTYRAYKYNFTGSPIEPPDVAAFAHGIDADKTVTVCYVSWNGATEVSSWNFYRKDSSGEPELMGTKRKTGFETKFATHGYEREIAAEGVTVDGKILGRSLWFEIDIPPEWEDSEDISNGQQSKQKENEPAEHGEL